MKKYSLMLVLAGWMLSSCNEATSPSELSEVQGVWELQAFQLSGATVAIPNPEKYTVRFDADGMLNARADCNGCFGSYETEGNSISIGTMGCTLAFCPPPSFDSQYTRALGSVNSFVRQGDELLLTYAEGVMRFLVD